jgi:hypothetical protein
MPNTSRPKNDQRIVFGVVIAVIIILVIAIFWSGGEANVFLPDSTEVDVETREAMDPAELQNFELVRAEDWDRYENASEDILVLGDDQNIGRGPTGNATVQDPEDQNTFYFTSNTSPGDENILSVYKYAHDEYSFERIYKQTFVEENLTYASHYMVAGIDNGELLILAYPPQESNFGTFCSYAREGQGALRGDLVSMYSINLDDPYAGLTEYTLPEDVKERLDEECLEIAAGMNF